MGARNEPSAGGRVRAKMMACEPGTGGRGAVLPLVPRLPLASVLPLAATLLLAAALPAAAQQVRGTVRDAGSGVAVASAQVELLGSEGTVLASALTSAAGTFALAAPGPGRYLVRAWRLGADSVRHGPVDVGSGETIEVEILLRARAIELDAVSVVVEAAHTGLERLGFYERRLLTSGVFLNPQQIAAAAQLQTIDLLRGVQGLEVDERSRPPRLLTRSGATYERRTRSLTCWPVIYLDGVMVQPGGEDLSRAREYPLSAIPTSSLVGVEVYPGMVQAPLQFGGGETTCGVIVLWTEFAAEAGLLVPPRATSADPPASGWDRSLEGRPYPWARVLGAAVLANGLGLAGGAALLGRCLERERDGARGVTCGAFDSAVTSTLALVLPATLGGVAARRVGSTERSRGRLVAAVLFGSGSTLTGYYFLLKGDENGRTREQAAAAVLFTVGTPLVVTLSDRFTRALR